VAPANTSDLSLPAGTFKTRGAAVDLAMPAAGSWKSSLSADVERDGFTDDRTSFARGHANYRGSQDASDRKLWLFADLNWLTQNPASPLVREGAALSTATPLDADYNPADAFLDDTRFSIAVGQERPILHNAR